MCGVPIRRNNKYGICSDQRKPACWKARALKREGASRPESRNCKICGKPLRRDNASGLCSRKGECARVRQRMGRGATDPMGSRPRITIKAGDTFGQWTALEGYSLDDKRVLCRCECGAEKRVSGTKLVCGETRSCGCARYVTRGQKAPYLIAGMVFNRLTVLEDVATCNDYARFGCECGNETTTKAVQVKLGLTKSCGCLYRERMFTHGFTRHPLHQLWNSIIQRCTNPNHASYRNYGGRGITVCDRWCDPWLFAEDIERDLGPRPDGWSLDRIDNERGYEPGNVRWADRRTQRLNQRTIARLTHERDALAARLAIVEAELEALKASRVSRKREVCVLDQDLLF